jgi:hypothetical protein
LGWCLSLSGRRLSGTRCFFILDMGCLLLLYEYVGRKSVPLVVRFLWGCPIAASYHRQLPKHAASSARMGGHLPTMPEHHTHEPCRECCLSRTRERRQIHPEFVLLDGVGPARSKHNSNPRRYEQAKTQESVSFNAQIFSIGIHTRTGELSRPSCIVL